MRPSCGCTKSHWCLEAERLYRQAVQAGQRRRGLFYEVAREEYDGRGETLTRHRLRAVNGWKAKDD